MKSVRTAATLAAVVILGLSGGLAANEERKDRPIIGDATMTENRTIIVRLRRTTDGKNVSGIVEYSVNDPHYLEVLNHLGGMNPGDTKPVPAWGDAAPRAK